MDTTLLTREQVAELRARAHATLADANSAEIHGIDELHALAHDVLRVLDDLAATPPIILSAPASATRRERDTILRDAAKRHRGPVILLPHGWQTLPLSDVAQVAVLAERERCAKVLDRLVATEKMSEGAAEWGSGHHTIACAMGKAFAAGAAAIRSGEG